LALWEDELVVVRKRPNSKSSIRELKSLLLSDEDKEAVLSLIVLSSLLCLALSSISKVGAAMIVIIVVLLVVL
jgi:hypothetical protein